MLTVSFMITGYPLLSSFGKAFLKKKRFDANRNVHTDWIPAIRLWSD
jgi:hypothetical protein